jgi:hypothetical protein
VSNPPGSSFCNVCGKELPKLSTTVKCPFCGADGQEYQINCTKCGKELPRERRITPFEASESRTAAPAAADASSGGAPPKTPSVTVNACPYCGRPKSIYDDKCSYCSQSASDLSPQDYGESSYSSESELPRIAGILILIAGVLGILHGLLLLGAVTGYGLPGSATCCPGIMVLFGLVAIAGGFSGISRGSPVMAIVGGVLGILSIGFFIGALMSLIGVILAAVSYHEFEG